MHTGDTWRIRLNRPRVVAMQPFCQITLTTCCFTILLPGVCPGWDMCPKKQNFGDPRRGDWMPSTWVTHKNPPDPVYRTCNQCLCLGYYYSREAALFLQANGTGGFHTGSPSSYHGIAFTTRSLDKILRVLIYHPAKGDRCRRTIGQHWGPLRKANTDKHMLSQHITDTATLQ